MIIKSNILLKLFCLFVGGMDVNAITIWPFIICEKETKITEELINHERIHLRQQIELLVIPFYIWYLIEFYKKGYYNCRFEKEAYQNQHDFEYLKNRKWLSFLIY